MNLTDDTLLQGGKYQIVRFLSSGGFGNTYEAIDVDHNKKVAIKEFFMKDSCNRDETTNRVIVATKTKEAQVARMKNKFMKEACALQNMSHPNIVHVENAFEENATAYYVMDYIEGTSLNDIIKVAGSLSETKALDYIMQIADALSYVHSKNILHLDIKPGNIMVDKNGKAILIDFGASKQYDEVTGENTSTLLGINTTGYASAEQSYRGFVQFAPSTDIYALGATLYKLLTGITPPDAQMLKDGEAELAPLPTGISASVKSALKEAMRPLRKDRPQCIGEFIGLLNKNERASIQKKKTEKPFDAKGSVNNNGISDNESTLLDLEDNSSCDDKEDCAQLDSVQVEYNPPKGNFITRYLSEKWNLLTHNIFSSFFYLFVFIALFVFGLYKEGLWGAFGVSFTFTGALACILWVITSKFFDEDSDFAEVSYFVYLFLGVLGIVSLIILVACAYLFNL